MFPIEQNPASPIMSVVWQQGWKERLRRGAINNKTQFIAEENDVMRAIVPGNIEKETRNT